MEDGRSIALSVPVDANTGQPVSSTEVLIFFILFSGISARLCRMRGCKKVIRYHQPSSIPSGGPCVGVWGIPEAEDASESPVVTESVTASLLP